VNYFYYEQKHKTECCLIENPNLESVFTDCILCSLWFIKDANLSVKQKTWPPRLSVTRAKSRASVRAKQQQEESGEEAPLAPVLHKGKPVAG